MNWEAIGAVGEIVGAAAVVLSIVYLAIQIRRDTTATMASASFDATHSWAQFNEQLLHAPDEVLTLIGRSYRPEAAIEDYSEAEWMRLVILHRTIFQKLEGQYFLFKHGLLDPGVWENRRRVARGILELPIYRAWWENELKNSTYSGEFARAIEMAAPTPIESLLRKPTEQGPDTTR